MRHRYCRLCHKKHTPFGGIVTTLGYICYRCVRWVHQVADQTEALRDRPRQAVLSDIDETP